MTQHNYMLSPDLWRYIDCDGCVYETLLLIDDLVDMPPIGNTTFVDRPTPYEWLDEATVEIVINQESDEDTFFVVDFSSVWIHWDGQRVHRHYPRSPKGERHIYRFFGRGRWEPWVVQFDDEDRWIEAVDEVPLNFQSFTRVIEERLGLFLGSL